MHAFTKKYWKLTSSTIKMCIYKGIFLILCTRLYIFGGFFSDLCIRRKNDEVNLCKSNFHAFAVLNSQIQIPFRRRSSPILCGFQHPFIDVRSAVLRQKTRKTGFSLSFLFSDPEVWDSNPRVPHSYSLCEKRSRCAKSVF